jgi:hypothetical protein
MIPNRPSFTYQDELALVTYLVDDLERKLAGRHETRVLRIIPSDHCHLGVLGPRDPHVEQPEPLEIADNDGTAVEEQEKPSQQRAVRGREGQPETGDDGPTETAVGEAEQIAAEQQGTARDSTRRPSSSLGFEIVAMPDVDSECIELTLSVQFCVYTQDFPTFEEQREELGRQASDAGTDLHHDAGLSEGVQPLPNIGQVAGGAASVGPRGRGVVSLLEAFVRRPVRIPPITIRIDPSTGSQRLTDNGVV